MCRPRAGDTPIDRLHLAYPAILRRASRNRRSPDPIYRHDHSDRFLSAGGPGRTQRRSSGLTAVNNSGVLVTRKAGFSSGTGSLSV